MNKPYITFPTMVLEFLGILASIISIVFAATGLFGAGKTIMSLGCVMLFVIIIMIAINHFLPPSAWNMPVKVKEQNALKVYSDSTFMIGLLAFEMGIYAIYSVVVDARPDSVLEIGTIVFCVLWMATIAYGIFSIIRDNK